MRDDFNSGTRRDGDGHKDGSRARRDHTGEHEVRPVVEREVPFGQQSSEHVLAASVHSWLDGELPEAAVRKGDTARDVEFWHNLNSKMDLARRMRTPEHIEAQIMAALPHHAPALISPWYRREFVITPMTAVSVATALVTLAVATTVALMAP